RRLPRVGGRLRTQVGGEGDRQGPPRHLGLRVGVPNEPAQPHARAGGGDGLRDGEPAGELRLLERREGDRGVRRRRLGARPRSGGPAARRALPGRPAGNAGTPRRMTRELSFVYDYGQVYLYDAAAAGSVDFLAALDDAGRTG